MSRVRPGNAQVFCALVLVALSAAPAFAWHDTGHMVSAYIAYKDLKPEVKQRVTQILRQHPRFKEDLLRDMPEGFADPDFYAFMKAATWPDMVRDRRNPMNAAYNHGNWHYIDFPLVFPAHQDKLHPPQPEIEGGQVDNILKAMAKSAAELKNAQTPAGDRAAALCWLSHLVGDLHQPLHATALFSEEYPEGDKGGNLFMVRSAGGEVVNLHALWDGLLGPQSNPDAVKLIADNILANPTNQRSALAGSLAHQTYKSWADESFAACREFVYNDGKLRGMARPARGDGGAATSQPASDGPATRGAASGRRGDPPTTAPALPTSYEEVARLAASQRIALAGYRLADQLNQLLAQP